MKNQHFLLFVVFSLSLFSCKEKEETAKPQAATEERLVPPIPEANIVADEYRITPTKDTVIYHKSGSVISIPKNAFLDEKGNVITTPVDLKFRMFSNPLEIYLAGIPMTFSNDNGEEMVFESAGMFEMNAFNKGKAVNVNPENKIQVDVVSYSEDTKFNRYDFDSESNTWKELGKDVVKTTTKEKELEQLPEVPEAPRIAGKFSFKVFDKLNENDKLKEYRDVWFDPVDGKKCGFDSKDILVKDLKNGTYEVTFVPWGKLPDTIKTKCICYLSFKDKAQYSKALNNYRKKYAGLLFKIQATRKTIDDAWSNYNKKHIEYKAFFARKEIKELNGASKIMRTLEVNQFGLVNLDYPHVYPKGAKLDASFVDENGKPIVLKQVVLVELGVNALYRYTKTVHFNPESQNILWGITEDGKLAYFTASDFKNLEARSGEVVFKMRVHPDELKTYDEIMAVLFKS
ncbi:hypothetical protein [Flavobacterium sasangense]|uniref:hypothetical protein n=1 Tax=Flavobacterium sasangense TaxID=503361 RepID=UPI000A92E551|nr:hypothetical protein [Flavobacterium sasangense]